MTQAGLDGGEKVVNGRGAIDVREHATRIRVHALSMTKRGGGTHIGAIFSCADVLAGLGADGLVRRMLFMSEPTPNPQSPAS